MAEDTEKKKITSREEGNRRKLTEKYKVISNVTE
jgi:hypothetical protein